MKANILDRTLRILRKHGVKIYNDGNLVIHFKDAKRVPLKQKKPEIATESQTKSSQPPDPNDFKGDDLMSFDQVLHWSGSPKPDEIPVPLAGDVPLDEPLQEAQ